MDHKSASAQPTVTTTASPGEKGAPFSVHNYNQHITPSPCVPYPQQNQPRPKTGEERRPSTDQNPDSQTAGDSTNGSTKPKNEQSESGDSKPSSSKPRVFTTVLHPTPQSLQAELTLWSTTPDPRAAANRQQSQTYQGSRAPGSSSAQQPPNSLPGIPSSPVTTDRPPPAKRQKMMVEPNELPEFEAKLIRATAPPLYLEPVDSLDASRNLLKFLESPLHKAKPPSPTTRRRTVAELAADEALAAEEERFMLIMDERLEPATSSGNAGSKSAVDDESGAAPFEPRFSRFKTIENIRLQHEEKAKREHERKLQQDHAKRQQQEAEREKRRIFEQRQAEDQARDESRRQHIAQQQAQAQAHIAATQAAAAQSRRPQSQGNNPMVVGHQQHPQQIVAAAQGQQSSPIIRNNTPHSSSPVVGNTMGPHINQGMPMARTGSAQGAGSPIQVTGGAQHAHPAMMGHPMAPSRSQQSQSRHGTPQMPHGTPAMAHATPIMRNATPSQRMTHGSPSASTMAQTPVLSQAMASTPQMGQGIMANLPNGMMMTPQQQQALLQQRHQMLAQHNQNLPQNPQLTPQQLAQIQANAHAQQNIQQAHQQHLLQQQQQPQQPQQPNMPFNQQAYQQQLMRSQLAQMHMAAQQHQGGHAQQHQQPNQPQISQQQMIANAKQNAAHRYQELFRQHLHKQRADMAEKFMQQYGPPANYPPVLSQQYHQGLEKASRQYVSDIVRKDREQSQQRAAHFAAAQAQAQAMQQHQHMMNGGGMGK